MSVLRRELLLRSLHALGGLAALQGLAGNEPVATSQGPAVLLLECHVAGTAYAQLSAEYETGAPKDAAPLPARTRQPRRSTRHPDVRPVGARARLRPPAKNEVLAHSMDVGIPAYAEVASYERLGSWLKVEARVFVQLRR